MNRSVVVGVAVLVTLGAVVVFRSLKREFVPPEDRGWFFSFIIAPEGSSLAYTDSYQRQAEAIQATEAAVLERIERGESLFTMVNFTEHVESLRNGRASKLHFTP